MRSSFAILAIGLILLGCQHLPAPIVSSKKEFSKKWVNSTIPEDYILQPLLHRMRPVVYGNTVIAGNGLDSLSAYNVNTGKVMWRLEVSGGVEGGAALDGTVLYFGANDGNFYAVNADSGTVKWKVPVGAEVLAAPLVLNEKIFFMSGNNMVHALKKSDGSKIWVYHRQQQSYFSVRAAATPLVHGNSLFVGSADGFFLNLNVLNGSLVWERQLNTNKKFKDVDSTPIMDGDRIYVSSFDGALFCLDNGSGKVVWKYDEGGYLPPVLQGESLFYPTTTKKFVALNKLTGKEIWKLENLDGIPTGSGIIGDNIFFGESKGDLKVVSIKNGKVGPSFHPGRGLIATPTYDEKSNLLFMMSNEGNLNALRLEEVSPY